jgi:RND family efflux transporter MFP subunit
MRRWTWESARSALTVATLTLGGLSGCTEEPTPASGGAAAATPVSVWIARSAPWTDSREWAGTLEPLRVHELRLPSPGRVQEISVREGDRVRAGATLLRIVSPESVARLPVLEERVARLSDELARWRELAAANAAGAGEVTAAELRLFEAREALAALEATRDALVIRAPVEGRVARIVLTPGREEGAGALALILEEEESYGVRVRVPTAEAHRFEAGAPEVRSASTGAELEVARIGVVPDPSPGFVQIELFLRNPPTTREAVRVRSTASGESVLVPWTAVAADGTRSWVAVAVPSSDDDGTVRYLVERRTVELGAAHPGGVEVRRGVEVGDRIIRFEPRSHREGRVVEPRILDPEAEGPGGTP